MKRSIDIGFQGLERADYIDSILFRNLGELGVEEEGISDMAILGCTPTLHTRLPTSPTSAPLEVYGSIALNVLEVILRVLGS